MKKRIRKILTCGLLASATALTALCSVKTTYAAETSAAEWQQSATYKGTNLNAQDYLKWSKPIKSYLVPCDGNRLMRVQYAESMDDILVEYYDKSYQFEESKVIPKELPVFGGFYESSQYYFILTGQKNLNKSSSTEVYRVTKYDKDWNRIDSAGLSNCNSKNPFDASSARMDTYKNYLLIRTGRTMDDGHQSNITFQLDMNTMKITDSYTVESNITAGYVSHSFNQFIKVEDGHIIAVDHGDAYPRSIVLTKYNSDLSNGRFSGGCLSADILKFAGTMMSGNSTGGSVGGLEISGSSYLVAGNSVVQDNSSLSRKTRNVFVAAADKKNINQVTMNWLTDYNEGEETASTPHMVKINEDSYVVLWSRNSSVYYTAVDGNGKQTGGIYEMQGKLSDCVPAVSNGKLVWYTWENENIVFYEINIRNLSDTKSKAIRNGKKQDSGTGSGQEDTDGGYKGTTPGTTPPEGGGTGTAPGTTPSAGNSNENREDTSSKEYTVTFHANGGSMGGYSFTDIQTTGQKLNYFPNPYRNGYTFEGWYTKADGGAKANLSTKYTADQTLYAHWKNNTVQKEYKITFNAEGGTVVGSTSRYTVGNKLEELPKAVKDGYEFVCWRTWEGNQITTWNTFQQDTELYAQWRKLETGPAYSGFKVVKLTSSEAEIQVSIPSRYIKYWRYGYGTSTEQMTESTVISPRKEMDKFTIKLSRLSPATKYYYRMYYITIAGKYLSDIQTFTTKSSTENEYTDPDAVYPVKTGPGTNASLNPETNTNSGTNVKPDTGINAKPDTGTNANSGTGTNVKLDTGTNANSGTGTNVKPDTGTDVQPEASSDTWQGIGKNEKPDTGVDVKPGEGSNTGESDTGVDQIQDLDLESNTNAGAKTSVKKVKVQSVKSTAAGKLKIKWKRYKGIDGYQISYSRIKGFPAKKTAIKNAEAASSSVKIYGLSKGKRYYVKVRAYKNVNGKIYNGKWSKAYKVKIKNKNSKEKK